jgi:hypothetical protein
MTTATVTALFPVRVESSFGTVVARSGPAVRVRADSGERDASIATSCLIAPEPGDRVLLVASAENAFVLAVLERANPGEAQLAFDGDVSLNVPGGRLRVFAREGLELASPGGLDVRVARAAADAQQVEVSFSVLNLLGQAVVSKTKTVRVIAEAVDTVAGRIYQRAVNFLRRTDELDRVEAKSIDRRAEQLVHVHGENAVTTAEELVKIDGSQVHVG